MEDVCKRDVKIPAGNRYLEGRLVVPGNARGLIVFVHGKGSSRFSPRNTLVAHKLQPAGFGTLLFDMMTAMEEKDPVWSRDIGLLSDRLKTVTEWIGHQAGAQGLPTAYFGSSTGAAVAVAASLYSKKPYAIVSRGGRIDLVEKLLPRLDTPIQLIAGKKDPEVLALNRAAYPQIRAVKKLSVIHDASHLFEEPGCLDKVAQLAVEWFTRHLPNHE